jgi:CDP-diacylglycerol---serine O-phosphatidyltransferase
MGKSGLARGVYILPNLFTAASLFFGFFSVLKTIEGDYHTAVLYIIISGLLDSLDGRIARLTRSESDFGVEFDSLVDLVSFGVAPALLIYMSSLSHFERFGWLAAFLFVACGALRLARFNVQSSDIERRFFQGLPIPAAAGELVTFVLFYRYFFGEAVIHPQVALGLVMTLSILMVSPVRYPSFKALGFKTRNSFYTLVAGLMVIIFIAVKPEVTMFCLGSLYIVGGFLGWIVFYKKRKEEEDAILRSGREVTGVNQLSIVNKDAERD